MSEEKPIVRPPFASGPLRRRDVILGGAMLATAGVAYARLPRQRIATIGPKQLDRIVPLRIGPWTYQSASGVVQPPPDELASLLYDQQVSRFYAANETLPIMLSMAYGNSQGGVLQVHRPEICYPASGYRLTGTETRAMPIDATHRIPVRFFSAQSDTRSEQVLYWTRIGTMLPTSWTSQRIAIMRSNIAGAIPDGLLVRLSTISDDPVQAYATLQTFARMMLAAAGLKGRELLLGTHYADG